MSQIRYDDASDAFICAPSDRDVEILERAFITAEAAYWSGRGQCSSLDAALEALGGALGDATNAVVGFYTAKAELDAANSITPTDSEPYEPWNDIGLPIPAELATIEISDDGSDWLRFGEIGPILFGFTGPVPDYVDTICVKKTEDRTGYEVVFVGHQADVARGNLL